MITQSVSGTVTEDVIKQIDVLIQERRSRRRQDTEGLTQRSGNCSRPDKR